jgi:hypothetical protein
VSCGGGTHPARATVARAPGGITLGREQGELGADFTALGAHLSTPQAVTRLLGTSTMMMPELLKTCIVLVTDA